MNEDLMNRNLWLGCGALFVALIIYLSLGPQAPEIDRTMGIKPGHFLAYAWLMFWFAQLFRGVAARVAVAAGLCTLGIGLEYLQLLTGRHFAYPDMADNAMGVMGGLILGSTPLAGALARAERAWKQRAAARNGQ